jgi:parvulin-like peptidyl-prolyl isomerase
MNRRLNCWVARGFVWCAVCGAAWSARAQNEAKAPAAGASAPKKAVDPNYTPVVAATIDGEPVYVKEVEVMMRKVAQTRGVRPKGLANTQAEVLKQVINRRLAVRAIERAGGYITTEEIDKALDGVKVQAKKENITADEFAARQGVSMETIRDEVIWTVAWERYLDRNMSDEMEGYFKAHQKDFDGTLIRASHILLRSDGWRESSAALVERAKKLREKIVADEISFEQAAQQYSVGPSRAKGGDLGFFPRFGVMVDDFSKTAFQLKRGEISEPVVTPFGVHLIRVTDEKPGGKQWTEVLDQMRVPASVELFEKLAEKEAATAKIEYTGVIPYFKPGTTEIVMPATSAAK